MRNWLVANLLCIVCATGAMAEVLSVPKGFEIEKIANVSKARSLVWGEQGTLFVGSQRGRQVTAVTGVMSGKPRYFKIGENLRLPNGVAFRDGDLYVAEITRILVWRDIESRLDSPGEPEVLVDDLPKMKQHSWKYIAFGPDDKLYVPLGAPCNVCDAPEFALILRMNPDGSNREIYARGVRNTVGFDWHPQTDQLWFTDNNRDMMGDDLPPGELNRVTRPDQHFGFPFCHGKDVVEPEPDLAKLGNCSESTPPAQELGPHVAALGMAFYTGNQFPEAYQNQIFIAEHGSWNRTEKIGYRVTLVRLNDAGNKALSYEPFATGWLKDGKVSGRPVDLVVAPDGSLLVSDDKQGNIYRISYAGANN
ncbi:MAG: PQQ-dependent sugar dehydrogenase [Gammaproteobacteria bacterium]